VKASATKRKYDKKVVRKETRAYEEKLQIELNIDREEHGKHQYKSNPLICAKCPSLSQCTEGKNHQKLIQRHIWESYVEEAEHLRHAYDIKQIYAKRKETIERVFADAKEKHGMRWTPLRGLKKLSMQAMLTFAAMNLKKLATWTWQAT